MEDLVHQRKNLALILVNQTQNFVWVYIIMLIIVICLLMENKSFKFKDDNVNFLTQFCLGSISNGFSATESRKVSLNENKYDFSVDYTSIDKSNMLNFHKYLITSNNIKHLSYLWVLVAL